MDFRTIATGLSFFYYQLFRPWWARLGILVALSWVIIVLLRLYPKTASFLLFSPALLKYLYLSVLVLLLVYAMLLTVRGLYIQQKFGCALYCPRCGYPLSPETLSMHSTANCPECGCRFEIVHYMIAFRKSRRLFASK